MNIDPPSGTGNLQVVAVSPADGASLPTPPATIEVQFSESLDASKLVAGWLVVDVESLPVAGSLTIASNDPKRLVFAPTAILPAAPMIRISLDSAIVAASGRRLAISPSYSFSIQTPSIFSAAQEVPVDGTMLDLLTTGAGEVAVNAVVSGSFTSDVAFYSPAARAWTGVSTLADIRITPTGLMVPDGNNGVVVRGLTFDAHHPRAGAGLVLPANRSAFNLFNRQLRYTTNGVGTVWSALISIGSNGNPSYYPHETWNPSTRSWAPTLPPGNFLDQPFGYVSCLPLDADNFQLLTYTEFITTGVRELRSISQARNGVRGPSNLVASLPPGTRLLATAYAANGRAMAVIAKIVPNAVAYEAIDFTPGIGWSAPAPVAVVPGLIGEASADAKIQPSSAAAIRIGQDQRLQTFALRQSVMAAWDATPPPSSQGAFLYRTDYGVTATGVLFTADFDRRRVAYRDAGAGTTWSPEILLTNSAALPAMSSIAGNSRIETIGDRRFLWVYALFTPGIANRSVDVTIP